MRRTWILPFAACAALSLPLTASGLPKVPPKVEPAKPTAPTQPAPTPPKQQAPTSPSPSAPKPTTTTTTTTGTVFDDDIPQPCKSHDACAPGDVDRDGIRDSWEDTLAFRWAPVLQLPPSKHDFTRPANVDWYLQRVHMRFENKGACNRDEQILDVGRVTQHNIAAQFTKAKSMTIHGCRKTGKRRYSNASIRFFLQPPNDDVHKGAPPRDWRAYVHVKRSSTVAGGYDVQYWFFYPYNDSFASFNHEGDWEHVTITTRADGAFVQAFYSQHHGGKVYRWDQLEKLEDHPVVYVADGSHANYSRVGRFSVKKFPVDRTFANGPRWFTRGTLIQLGEKAFPRNGQTFLKYGGRWGEIGELADTSGPRGPAFQGSWTGL